MCYGNIWVKVKCLDVSIFLECDCLCTSVRVFGGEGYFGGLTED